MFEVEIRHPHGASVVPAAALLNDLEAGRWGSVAYACMDMLTDADAAARELNEVAVRSVEQSVPEPLLTARATGFGAVFESASYAHIVRALDVFMRVLEGQWSEVGFTGAPVADSTWGFDLQRDLHTIRGRWTRPGMFPDHPYASWGIHAAPQPAQVAYGAWKSLGEGIQSRPVLLVDGDAVQTIVRERFDAV